MYNKHLSQIYEDKQSQEALIYNEEQRNFIKNQLDNFYAAEKAKDYAAYQKTNSAIYYQIQAENLGDYFDVNNSDHNSNKKL